MDKRALGKGLDQLMSGQSVARKTSLPARPSSSISAKVTAVDFGRGLNTLVTSGTTDKEAPAKAPLLLPAWFFFTADLLLLTYTIAICFDRDGPMGAGELAFAFVSTALGALLAIMGVLRVVPAQRDVER